MTLEGTRQIIAQGPALVEFGAARRLAVATARSQNRRSRSPSNGELQTTEMMLSYTIGAPSASQMIPPRTNAASTTRAQHNDRAQPARRCANGATAVAIQLAWE
jgi:hypothetical protein